MGYEPVLFERGHIPYRKDVHLEESCYREISNCDVVVSIVGGKFGTQSKDDRYSITQRELKTAIELGKQIYVFIERSVHAEYRTYQANRDMKGFRPTAVDDVRVFAAIEDIYSLPLGNPVEPFEISDDIVRFLREQWAGLFQRLMQEASRAQETNILQSLDDTAEELKKLVRSLKRERESDEHIVKDILLSNHPVFSEMQRVLKIPYRIVFHSLKELEGLLFARGFRRREKAKLSGYSDWENKAHRYGVSFATSLFDDKGSLRVIGPESWSSDWIATYPLDRPMQSEVSSSA
jgi:hypothetical protein